MISLICEDWVNGTLTDDGALRKLLPQMDGVNTWVQFNSWLMPHNASYRDGDNGWRWTTTYIDFEDEADAIVFKLKFGL